MVGRGSAWAPAAASCVCGQEEGPRGGSCGGREGGLLQGDRASPYLGLFLSFYIIVMDPMQVVYIMDPT